MKLTIPTKQIAHDIILDALKRGRYLSAGAAKKLLAREGIETSVQAVTAMLTKMTRDGEAVRHTYGLTVNQERCGWKTRVEYSINN